MNSDTLDWINTYPNFLDCSIQTFNDRDKEDKCQSRILPMTEENLEKCVELQNKLPYWIFFSVNPMELGKRNRDSVKMIQTWICDIDDWDKEKQLELIKKAKLQPSLVVESNHWFHLYYIASKELSVEEFENWNRGLKNYYWWDAKVCKDTARVLRIPWYYHMKWEKYLVKYRKDLSSHEKYTMEQMTDAFPNQLETTAWRIKEREQYAKTFNEKDTFWSRAWELDNKTMLEEFSGTWWMRWDRITFKRNSSWTEQIYVNGKSTGCWIDEVGKIGSWDWWWPTWIKWLKWYGTVDFWELAKELKKKYPHLGEKKEKVVEKLDTDKLIFKSTRIPRLEKPSFTRGNEWLDNALGKLKRWQLVILCWETWAWKTTFATFMARQNQNCCYYVLEDKVENIAMRYAMKYAGITKKEYNEWSWSDEKEMRYEEWYNKFINKWFEMIDIGHKITVSTLLESMMDMKAKGCGIFFIDNLWFVVWEWQNEAQQTADASNRLVSFCLEQNVCIVLLHHFKKKWSVSDIRDISQMRWSGKLGDDAFMVVEYMRDDDCTWIRVYKDRTWGDLNLYEIKYNRWDFDYIGVSEQ